MTVRRIGGTCDPQIPAEESAWLSRVGLPSSRIATFNYGCPAAGVYAASTYQAAVLKFQQAGVTDVTAAGLAGWPFVFTRYAAQQGFKPKYGLPDQDVDSILTVGTNTADSPNDANLAGALLIATGQYGAEHTPGMTLDRADRQMQRDTSNERPAAGSPGSIRRPGVGRAARLLVWPTAVLFEVTMEVRRGEALASGNEWSGQIDAPAGHRRLGETPKRIDHLRRSRHHRAAGRVPRRPGPGPHPKWPGGIHRHDRRREPADSGTLAQDATRGAQRAQRASPGHLPAPRRASAPASRTPVRRRTATAGSRQGVDTRP